MFWYLRFVLLLWASNLWLHFDVWAPWDASFPFSCPVSRSTICHTKEISKKKKFRSSIIQGWKFFTIRRYKSTGGALVPSRPTLPMEPFLPIVLRTFFTFLLPKSWQREFLGRQHKTHKTWFVGKHHHHCTTRQRKGNEINAKMWIKNHATYRYQDWFLKNHIFNWNWPKIIVWLAKVFFGLKNPNFCVKIAKSASLSKLYFLIWFFYSVFFRTFLQS